MKLVYFAARGTCDQIRILLAETQLKHQELNVSGNEFIRWKEEMPFPTLPMWQEEGLTIVHANAIMRYLARKTGLNGSNEKEQALCDMWDEQIESILKDFWNTSFMKEDLSDFQSEASKNNYLEKILIPQYEKICEMMSKNPFPFLVGNKLNYVDIKLFSLLDAIAKEIPLTLAAFPLLQTFHSSILKRPHIYRFCRSEKRF